jgi:CheY-like chemotaxis protein
MLKSLVGKTVALEFLPGSQVGAVEADPLQLQHVIVNLGLNAREAMPDGGRLTIRTGSHEVSEESASQDPELPAGDYVILEVSDTGRGMDEATRSKLFEPFFSTKGTRAGLGLATVYGIVKQSEGHIVVRSEPGMGATFRIYLPRAAGLASPEPVPSPTSRRQGAETVLLVEDEPVVRSLMREILQRNGYTVLDAGDGPQAIKLCKARGEEIDLLLSDVVMPRMSGAELARRVASELPDTKVLFVSAYGEETLRLQGYSPPEGETHFLSKPFTPDELLDKIREVLDAPGAPTPNG